jgi:hypothetical protein
MDAKDIGEAIRTAAESIRMTPPVRRRENAVYALAVKSGYGEIRKLREEGYSYEVICATLSEQGVLPIGASPKNFCSAFLRETKRREKRAMEADASNRAEVRKSNAAGFKNTDSKTERPASPRIAASPDHGKLVVNPDNTFNIRPSGLSKEDIDGIEKKIQLNDETYKHGMFNITKHSDGSFDYEDA